MYAVLQQGGHQYRVEPGDRLLVDRLDAQVGSTIELSPVLFGSDMTAAQARDAHVSATVIAHHLDKKIRVFKYKPKKRYRRTMGHRQQLTELRVEGVLKAGEKVVPAEKTTTKRKPTAAKAEAAVDKGTENGA